MKPWYAVGKIQHGGNVFASMDLDWCPRCRSEEDTNTEAEYGGGVYVYKRTCARCGVVIKHGAYSVPMINGGRPLPEVAIVWCHTPGRDRR